METFIVLLRAVNVGGTGKLAMSDLRTICESLGFRKVRTSIASGNVLFESDKTSASVKKSMDVALQEYAGKPVGVVVLTAGDLLRVLEANPFSNVASDRAVVIFLDEPLLALGNVSGQKNESIELGEREIFVHYPDGIGQSKLKIANAKVGTARNINTISKLVKMAASEE